MLWREAYCLRERKTAMERQLRVGIAIYNAGEHHAAHDAWEERWLELKSGTEDERFLHGLIQFTAAVYHARNRNWAGATGLAESAQAYLDGLPKTYRGVDVRAVRDALAQLEVDPESIERQRPPTLTYDGNALALDELDFTETCLAATVLADEYGHDEGEITRAIELAERAIEQDESNQFVGLLFSFVQADDKRELIFERLSQHLSRERRRDEDISGLF